MSLSYVYFLPYSIFHLLLAYIYLTKGGLIEASFRDGHFSDAFLWRGSIFYSNMFLRAQLIINQHLFR